MGKGIKVQISTKSHEVKYHRHSLEVVSLGRAQNNHDVRLANVHLAQLTENGTTASVLELLPPSLSLLKKRKRNDGAFLDVINKLMNIMIDCLVTRTRMRLLYCTSPRLFVSGYSEPDKIGFAREIHLSQNRIKTGYKMIFASIKR